MLDPFYADWNEFLAVLLCGLGVGAIWMIVRWLDRRPPELIIEHKPIAPAWTRDIEPRGDDEATDALYDTSSQGLMLRYGIRATQQIHFARLQWFASNHQQSDFHRNRAFGFARLSVSCAFKVRPDLDPRSNTPAWALLRAMEDARAIRHRQALESGPVEAMTTTEPVRTPVWFVGDQSRRAH